MGFVAVYLHLGAEFEDLAVYAHLGVSLFAKLIKEFAVMSFPTPDYRGENEDFLIGIIGQYTFVDLLLGVGPLCRELVASASALPEGARVNFETSADLAAVIASHVRRRDAILVKGSRGMRMERVVEAIVAVHPVVQG